MSFKSSRSFFQSAVFAGCFAVLSAGQFAVAEEAAPSKVALAGGKLLFLAPANWEEVAKKSNILDNEFRAPKEAKDDAARITIMRSGGGVEANVDRWIGQFEGATKNDAKIEKKEVAGTKIHVVDISGTFKDSMGGGPLLRAP